MAARAIQFESLRDLYGPIALQSVEEEIHAGILAWTRGLARVVLAEMWSDEVERICGPRWNPRGRARIVRAGSCGSEILLGGEWVEIRRPRIRTRAGRERPLRSFRLASERDLLAPDVLEAILMGATTGHTPTGASDDPMLARFSEELANRLSATIWRPLPEVAPILLIGGLSFRVLSILACVQIEPRGVRELIALRAGSCAEREAVEGMLDDLARRSANPHVTHRLAIGADVDALHDALEARQGGVAPRQRCSVQRTRRVLASLPPNMQPLILEALQRAYATPDAEAARAALEAVVRELSATRDAADLVRSGIEDTLTLHRLGLASAGRKPPPSGPYPSLVEP